MNRNSTLATVALATLILMQATTSFAKSLYAESSYKPLTADRKARQVGDIVTIQIIEVSSASTNVDTDARRSSSVEISTSTPKNSTNRRGLSADNQFEGGGQSQRAGRLLATVSVSIREVLPNGDLVLAGEQQLDINDEKLKISLKGRVRALDVSEANVVMSTKMADAQIAYVGAGELTERQRPSWWSRLLRAVGI
jgi:flagellar L-ring protein FlgH